jgi:hypothetical protein
MRRLPLDRIRVLEIGRGSQVSTARSRERAKIAAARDDGGPRSSEPR